MKQSEIEAAAAQNPMPLIQVSKEEKPDNAITSDQNQIQEITNPPLISQTSSG